MKAQLHLLALVAVLGCAEQQITNGAGTDSHVRVTALRASDAMTPLASTARLNVWVEHAYATSGTPYDSISAYWTVPANPTGAYGDTTTHVAYKTFPALENRPKNSIFQPVLQFTAEYTNIGQWILVNMHCYTTRLQGTVCDYKNYNANKHPLPGDVIYGSVRDAQCDSTHTNCTWQIQGLDAAANDSQVDTYRDTTGTGPFVTAIGGAVEVDTVTQCSQYPFSGVVYHGVYVTAGGQRTTPTWDDTVTAGISPNCSFGVYSNLDTIKLYHNYPPPAPLSVTIHGPTRVRPYTPCYYYAVPSGGARPITYGWNPVYQEQDSSVVIIISWDAILRVQARDSLDQIAQASMLIDTSSSAKACPSKPMH